MYVCMYVCIVTVVTAVLKVVSLSGGHTVAKELPTSMGIKQSSLLTLAMYVCMYVCVCVCVCMYVCMYLLYSKDFQLEPQYNYKIIFQPKIRGGLGIKKPSVVYKVMRIAHLLNMLNHQDINIKFIALHSLELYIKSKELSIETRIPDSFVSQ